MSKKHRKNFRGKVMQVSPTRIEGAISPVNQNISNSPTSNPTTIKHSTYMFLENWQFKREMKNIALVFSLLLVLLIFVDYLSIKTGLIKDFSNRLSTLLHIQS